MPEETKAMTPMDWAQLIMAGLTTLLPIILEIIKMLREDPEKATNLVQMLKGAK